MKTMLQIMWLAVLTFALALPASATLQFGWTNGVNATFGNAGVVPDGNLSGWSDTRTLSGLSGTIQDVSVNLHLSGGWNGDLYAHLVHDTGFTVLLDRVGTPALANGYGDTGFNVTLGLTGNPIESYQSYPSSFNESGQLLGNWAAHSGLGSLVGLDPNGSWSLFIADHSGGGVTTVTSWGLELNIVAVPEVETWVAAALAGMFGACWLNRQIWGRKDA